MSSSKRKNVKVVLEAGSISDGNMGPPFGGGLPAARSRSRELSSLEVEAPKKLKVDSRPVDVTMGSDSSSCGSRESRTRAKKVKSVKKTGMTAIVATADGANGRMQCIARRMNDVVLSAAFPDEDRRKVMNIATEFSELVVALIAANERLRGQLSELRSSGAMQGGVPPRPQLMKAPVAAGPNTGARPVPGYGNVREVPVVKPVETWSVVVKGKGVATSEEVVTKVKEQVAPTLGVRVHEVHPTKEGAVIRTPTKAERQKIVDNCKFGEVGLEVSIMDKLGPKIEVQNVEKIVSTDEFMEGLYDMNLKDMMPRDKFIKSVRLVTSAWGKGDGSLNVKLECTPRVAEHLRSTGVYILWYRFLVKVMDPVATCHRCCGFGHMARMCKLKQDVCRLCGQTGHVAARCVNPAYCRNCAARGRPSDHSMISFGCPEYAAMVARAEARH